MWDTTEWREKTADLIKISAPIRVLQRKRTNRRCLGTDRFITQNLLRVTEAGESTSALQTGRQRPGNPMVHFQAKDSLLENFFFFFWFGDASLPGLSWPSIDWAWPTHTMHGNLLYSEPTNSTEKATATHSSTLAWKIPRTDETGRLQSMGLRRVRHN